MLCIDGESHHSGLFSQLTHVVDVCTHSNSHTHTHAHTHTHTQINTHHSLSLVPKKHLGSQEMVGGQDRLRPAQAWCTLGGLRQAGHTRSKCSCSMFLPIQDGFTSLTRRHRFSSVLFARESVLPSVSPSPSLPSLLSMIRLQRAV